MQICDYKSMQHAQKASQRVTNTSTQITDLTSQVFTIPLTNSFINQSVITLRLRPIGATSVAILIIIWTCRLFTKMDRMKLLQKQ